MTTTDSKGARSGVWFLAVLSVLLGFASISTDLYLPALPAMAEDMGAGEGTLEWTISSYLAGFAFGQLLWGPVSDRYGRRGPVTLGVLVFAVGSAGCAMSAEPWQIICWRVVQALGASAGVALARAMVRDLYERDHAARLLSTLMTVMAIAPLIGPVVGAQILEAASWRAIFWTLVAIGLVAAAAIRTLPETLAPGERVSIAPGPVLAGYAGLFGNRQFVAYAAAIGLYFAGIFASIAGTPFAYIDYHGLSPDRFAILFAASVVGLMVANTANARLVGEYGTRRMLLVGTGGAAAFGAMVAVLSATGWGGVYGLAGAVFLFVSMNGFILANAVAGALSTISTRAGAASALLGAIQYGSGMVGSALVGLFADGTPWPMGAVMALAGMGSLAGLLLAGRR